MASVLPSCESRSQIETYSRNDSFCKEGCRLAANARLNR
jgi:hypothetical protein